MRILLLLCIPLNCAAAAIMVLNGKPAVLLVLPAVGIVIGILAWFAYAVARGLR